MTAFGPFRLDEISQCLWRDEERISLAPKTFSVLKYLVSNPGKLVTQDELLQAVWPETFVQPEVLRKYVQELRRVLGDPPKNPMYIETLPKRGYRFLAAVANQTGALSARPLRPMTSAPVSAPPGRAGVLNELEEYFDKALVGQRQMILITGEPGIGKTTVVDAFQRMAASREGVRVVRGQCAEGFGGKEAYYPVLEATGQLVRGPGSAAVIQVLTSQAPSWLIQFPALLGPGQREALQRELLGATRERMVREICEAFDTITADAAVVLILEDLHWVDASTLDLLSALARRRAHARLLVLGTYRPVEVILSQSPLKGLKQDLVIHRLCHEIVLERLTESDVRSYLAGEVSGGAVPEGLAALVHLHSDGNPLFMTAITADLIEKGLLRKSSGGWVLGKPLEEIRPGVPDTLQQMLEVQVDQLSDLERRVLMSATIAGQRFSAWAISAILNMDVAAAEETCEEFAQHRHFLASGRPAGLLGADQSAPYEFRHSLYREALLRRVPPAQRAQMHRALAEKAERLVGPRSYEFASELALHFEHGRDPTRAAHYLVITAENASRRYGHGDALAALLHARELLLGGSSEATHEFEIEILEKISDAQYALGDMRESARTDGSAAALAAEWGMKTAQVNALTRAARAYSFLDPDDCVAVCEMAAGVCTTISDPLLAARTEKLAACWRIVNDGWTLADSQICAAARAKILELRGPELPAYYDVLYAHVQALQGEHEDSCSIADAGIQRATETHSLVVYLSSLSSKSLALIYLGRWGELRGVLLHAIELAEKNGTDPWSGIFRSMLAWLHALSCDFDGAREQANELLRMHTEDPIGQAQSVALLTCGRVDLATGNYAAALRAFLKVRDRPLKPKVFLQWYWRMLAAYGAIGAMVESGDLESAGLAADEFLQDALSTADPAMRALGWDGVTRVATSLGDFKRADECVRQALGEIGDRALPSVSPRVNATASRLYVLMGDLKKAAEYRESAVHVLEAAARCFDQGDSLRASLYNAAESLRARLLNARS